MHHEVETIFRDAGASDEEAAGTPPEEGEE